jgi:hypothetical protein
VLKAEMRRLAPVALALLALPASASAATVEVVPGGQVRYRADPRERNRALITVAADSVVISDEVDLHAGSGCTAAGLRSVRCTLTPNGTRSVRVWLGDASDRARVAGSVGAAVTFDGGPGDDRILGGRGRDRFLEGRTPNGADTIGSRGNDDGVVDSVDYHQRRRPVRVTLDGGRNDGEAGERDRIGPNVHEILAGHAADLLVGGRAADHLEGHDGRDRIRGKGGDDYLVGDPWVFEFPRSEDRIDGGPGADLLKGGAGDDRIRGGSGEDIVAAGTGDDRIYSSDGRPDTIGCGWGADWVDADVDDMLDTDCEARLP